MCTYMHTILYVLVCVSTYNTVCISMCTYIQYYTVCFSMCTYIHTILYVLVCICTCSSNQYVVQSFLMMTLLLAGVQPNPYSVYRFFDCNDHDTTIVTSSNSPEFNDLQVYPVPVTVDLDRYLRKEVCYNGEVFPYSKKCKFCLSTCLTFEICLTYSLYI